MDNASLGARIKSARNEKNLTAIALAKNIGSSKSAVNQWEANKKNPSDISIKAIARALDVDVVWLRTGEGEKKPEAIYPKYKSKPMRLESPPPAQKYGDSNPDFDNLLTKMYRVYYQGDQQARDALRSLLAVLDPGPLMSKKE